MNGRVDGCRLGTCIGRLVPVGRGLGREIAPRVMSTRGRDFLHRPTRP